MKLGTIQPAEEDPPKGVPLQRILAKVQKMYLHFTELLGEKFQGPVVPDLCNKLRVHLHLRHQDMATLRCSLEQMLEPNQVLSKFVLKSIILKFSQNIDYILKDEIIPKWTGSPPLWSIVKIEDAKLIHIKEIPFLRLDVHTLTGVLAGEMHHILLPIKYVRWLAKEMGYPKYEKAHEREIVGMVSFIRLDTTKHGRTTISKAKPTGGQKQYNRSLARARIDKNCVFKTISCCACSFGVDKCPLACRLKTKETQHETDSSSVGP